DQTGTLRVRPADGPDAAGGHGAHRAGPDSLWGARHNAAARDAVDRDSHRAQEHRQGHGWAAPDEEPEDHRWLSRWKIPNGGILEEIRRRRVQQVAHEQTAPARP